MNPHFFIARKILKSKHKDISNNIVKISIGTITLCIVVMLLSIFIVQGFKTQVEQKVTGFIGNLRISMLNVNESPETPPLALAEEQLLNIKKSENIVALNKYATKPGILKTKENIEGIVFKGIDKDFSKECFTGEIIKGEFPEYSDEKLSTEILISKIQADKLNVKAGDKLDAYFIYNENPRVRRFLVKGIYESGFTNYDEIYVIADINVIRQLNNWTSEQVTGYEIFLNTINNTENEYNRISSLIPYDCSLMTVYDINYQVFDWLKLQDVNVIVLLVIMGLVCLITMISVIIIIIIERTSMIGVLKAIGMRNKGVRKVFFIKSAYIVGLGILLGNIISISLAFIQMKWGLISLDKESYYINKVPIEMSWSTILLVDISTFFICFLIIYLTTVIISKIKPVNAIRYE